MRIIAGEHRGRILESPPGSGGAGDTTRPITDRAKQSLFDTLAPRLPDARVADVFAGTGSMGLECLSRAAAHATFFEADRGALTALTRNIAALRLEKSSTVIAGDVFKLLPKVFPPATLDVIFLDPPYAFLRERRPDLEALAHHLAAALAPDGVLLFRHDNADALSLPGLRPTATKSYGSMLIEFLTV